jgi:hypothetical protein
MNYCSLEDAWGKKTSMLPEKIKPSEQTLQASFPKEQSLQEHSQRESFGMITQDDERLTKIRKHVEEIYNCDGIMNHLRHCRTCYNKMKHNFSKPSNIELFRPSLTEHFEGLIDDNRDSIVLILVGISILLFINLINNVTKK